MKFKVKIFLSIILLITISVGIEATILISNSFNSLLDSNIDNYISKYRTIQYTLSAVEQRKDGIDIDRVISTMNKLAYTGGESLVSTQMIGNGVSLYSYGEEKFLDGDSGEEVNENKVKAYVQEYDNNHVLQLTGKFAIGDRPIVLKTAYKINEPYIFLESQQIKYRQAYIVLLVFVSIITLVISGWLSSPLHELSNASKKIAEGEFGYRANVYGDDEFSRLANDFNYMAMQVENKVVDLEEAAKRQKDFTGAFAHEMKTPMTSIIGYADILRSQSDISPESRKMAADYIFSEGKRLDELSRKLLELFIIKGNDFSFQMCKVYPVINSVLKVVEPTLKSHNIEVQFNHDEGEAMIDDNLLETLILNIVDNAIKAMPNGGHIKIDERFQDKICYISISDDGCGIEKKDIERITEAFYRVDKSRARKYGGAGLGLSIVKEIASLHNGYIEFKSEPGEGTTVIFAFEGGKVDEI